MTLVTALQLPDGTVLLHPNARHSTGIWVAVPQFTNCSEMSSDDLGAALRCLIHSEPRGITGGIETGLYQQQVCKMVGHRRWAECALRMNQVFVEAVSEGIEFIPKDVIAETGATLDSEHTVWLPAECSDAELTIALERAFNSCDAVAE